MLVPLAEALQVSLDDLIRAEDDDDVVISAIDAPAELVMVFDREGQRAPSPLKHRSWQKDH